MSILLALFAYISNPTDWQHYPRLDNIRNFTADAFNTVYLVTENAILELDRDSELPEKVISPGERLPIPINLAIYDPDNRYFWITTETGQLYVFPEIGGPVRRISTGSTFRAERIGLDSRYFYLDYGSTVTAVHKNSKQVEDSEPGNDVTWVGQIDAKNVRDKYPFLSPWYLIDDELISLPYNQVFTHRNKAYVTVPEFGYMVFDAMSWNELLRYRGPKHTGVHSIFSADSSLYAIGETGVNQLLLNDRIIISHSFDRWGTTVNETPSWSEGAYSKLRRTNYKKVELIGDNLFLLQNSDADVLNIPAQTISEITSNRFLYDIDYNSDSLFLATDDGVFIALLPDDEPIALIDERTKLYRDDVFGIVRGGTARYFWTGRMVVKQSPDAWEYFTSPSFIPVPQEAIAGRDSLIVLGGEDGLVIYNPETYFQQRLTTDEGLLSNNVTALYIEDNYLWIATDAGLSRFDMDAVLP